MMGVDLTAIPTIGPETALVIASENGPTVSAFPTMQQFCSWLGLAPGTRISGDRRLRSKGRPPVNRVGQALRMAAMSARRSQSYIGAKHRSRLARMDTQVAIKATAHELARMVLLAAPDRKTWSGRRDHAFILTAVQTGLRLSEMTGLKREDFVSGRRCW